MKSSEIFDHYAAIMDQMIASNDFWKIYFQAPMPLYNEKDIPFFLYSGATRACLVDSNFPYVVKWNTIEAGSTDCAQEEIYYCDACAEDVAQYFLEPIYLGTYTRTVIAYDASAFYDERGMDEKYYPTDDEFQEVIDSLDAEGYMPERQTIEVEMWAYPRADPIKHEIKLNSFADEVRSSAHTYYHGACRMSEGCYCMWIAEVGEEEFNRIHQFLLDEDINDLHCGNMMMYQGHLVFSDYAGI